MSDTFDHELDAFERHWNGEEDYFEYDDTPREPYRFYCKYCGKYRLKWGILNGKWRLIEKSGEIHNCAAYTESKEVKVEQSVEDIKCDELIKLLKPVQDNSNEWKSIIKEWYYKNFKEN